MNVHQKIAFGGFVMLVVALSVTTLYDQKALLMLTAFALIVFLLTLPGTWKLIFLSVQAVGVLVGGIGHAVGIIGDIVADWSEEQRSNLTAPSSSRVPDWDSPELQTSAELDAPSFMDETLDRQNN